MADGEREADIEAFGTSVMRYLIVLYIFAVGLTMGCWSKAPTQNPSSSESNQQKPPDLPANYVASTNPRDPKNKKERPDMNPAATPEATSFRTAPENSEHSVMMDADGSIKEVRVFKSHPQIAKVEATWTDPSSKNLKVYLKNGKTLEAKTDKIPSLQSAASELILQSVGNGTAPPTGDRPRIANVK